MSSSLVKRGTLLVGIVMLSAIVVACGTPSADQQYPDRQITFVVPYAPGGTTDPLGRAFVDQLAQDLDASIVVENREGGAATLGTNTVIQAEPDGYTIGMSTSTTLAFLPLVNQELPYDGVEDYQPMVKLAEQPVVLAVRDDAPWQTFEEFMDYARDNPREIEVSTAGQLSTPDLAIQELNRASDVEMTTVPFTGGGQEALTALLSDRVDAHTSYPANMQGEIEADRIRPLAVFQEDEFYLYPDAASVIDAGYNARIPGNYYLIAPPDLPEEVLNTLVEASQEAAQSEEFLQFLEDNGFNSDPIGPEEIEAEIREDTKVYRGIAEATNAQ